MSELKVWTAQEIANSEKNFLMPPIKVYLKSEADKVIADLDESHKKEVEQLLMKIAGLEKLVETADKLLKQKGGFTVKDITIDGVKLEGFKKEVTNAVDKSNT